MAREASRMWHEARRIPPDLSRMRRESDARYHERDVSCREWQVTEKTSKKATETVHEAASTPPGALQALGERRIRETGHLIR
jgi:NADH:ubiquinone oxidoreductase subunit